MRWSAEIASKTRLRRKVRLSFLAMNDSGGTTNYIFY
jgi:hypothetical protein